MRQAYYILSPMVHDIARVSLRLHQTDENWEASCDFPRFSDELTIIDQSEQMVPSEQGERYWRAGVEQPGATQMLP